VGDQIEGTELAQRRFDEITGQHPVIKIEKVIPPEVLLDADLSGMAPADPCGGGFLPYDSEGNYMERG
jgi:hypothetical protein